MFKLVFYVPVQEAERVKDAVFATGAGKLGNYSHCSWETKGTGQFKPLEGSHPAIGDVGEIEEVEEMRVEILCTAENIKAAIESMKLAHSYEEPAYEVYTVLNLESFQ
jgi:hypothetical protein